MITAKFYNSVIVKHVNTNIHYLLFIIKSNHIRFGVEVKHHNL